MLVRPSVVLGATGRRSFSSLDKPLPVSWFTPIGVVGGGIMGGGIAANAAMNGFNVVLIDISKEAIDKTLNDVGSLGKKMFSGLVKKGKMTPSAAERTLKDTFGRIKTSTDLRELNECSVVVESIVENMNAKKDLLETLSKIVQKDSIVGSNTSSLPITELGASFGDQSRFCGLHFFNPVMMMPLVEVVRTQYTSDRTYNAAVRFAKSSKKVPVKCKDTPGFIVNRLLVPYLTQALLLVERGDASMKDVDLAMKLGANMPQGPFQLADFVGLDTCASIIKGWMNRYPDEKIFQLPDILEAKVKDGKLGRKSGEGMYVWNGDKIVE